MSLVCFHIRDGIRHGISDTPRSIPTALPRADPQTRLQNRLSFECFTYSGHFQGMLLQFVPSWRPKISQKSPQHSCVSCIRPQVPMTASACVYHLLQAVKRGPMSTCSSTFTTCHGAVPDQFSALVPHHLIIPFLGEVPYPYVHADT